MIYVDTSAFIKLYLQEDGTAEVHRLVVGQQEPLPVWSLMELEFVSALRFMVFLAEMEPDEVERVISRYLERKRGGQYFVPFLDPVVPPADLEDDNDRMSIPRYPACRGCSLVQRDAVRHRRQAAGSPGRGRGSGRRAGLLAATPACRRSG